MQMCSCHKIFGLIIEGRVGRKYGVISEEMQRVPLQLCTYWKLGERRRVCRRIMQRKKHTARKWGWRWLSADRGDEKLFLAENCWKENSFLKAACAFAIKSVFVKYSCRNYLLAKEEFLKCSMLQKLTTTSYDSTLKILGAKFTFQLRNISCLLRIFC